MSTIIVEVMSTIIVEEILLVLPTLITRVVIARELQDKIIDEFASSDKNIRILLL